MPSSESLSKPKRVLDIAIAFVFVTGVIGFASSMIAPPVLYNLGVAFDTFEFPIGYPVRVVADAEGRIFCHSNPYSRMQIYDKTGRFITGWFVGIGHLISVDAGSDTVHILAPNDVHSIYDIATGRIVTRWEENGAYRKYEPNPHPYEFQDERGNEYQVNCYFRTTISRTSPQGEKAVVVRERLSFFLIRAPIPAVIFILVPLIVWAIRRKLRARREGEE